MYRLPKTANVLRQARAVRQFHRAAIVCQDKRPLQQAQLKGSSASGGAKAASPPVPPPASTVTSTGGGGGGGGGALFGVAALAAVGGGAYYYYTTTTQTNNAVSKDLPIQSQSSETTVATESHRVTQIDMPAKMKNTSTAVSSTMEHPADGHKVIMTPATQDESSAAEDNDEQAMESDRALAALKTSVTEAAAEALLASHPTMWTATSVTAATTNAAAAPLGDLDALSDSQLKGRIVQLATELKDRTKWEALRLKEFLAMKEQEVSNE